MSSTRHVEVRPGVYRDSVTLMQLSVELEDHPGVEHALVAMGTTLNLELLTESGYPVPDHVGAHDLVIAFDAADTGLVLGAIEAALVERSTPVSPGAEAAPPRSLSAAARRVPATVALISVPGEHGFRSAIDAIEAGLHPVLFSDNVTVEHEIVLKDRAADAGLLVMGPDCGTVVLDGVGLGFANVLLSGPIGLVSASGTGAQQVSSLCADAGVGVRHVLGVGGRDLSDEIAGRSALAALRMLDDDPRIELIGVIAKEIGPRTRPALDSVIADLATPVLVLATDDLTAGAAALVSAAGGDLPEPATWEPSTARPSRSGSVLGLYSGGTLAAEAAAILGVHGEVIDLGDDRYTHGRPHPMIDDRLRRERLAAAAADDAIGCLLFDVVLGNGAAIDPSAGLVPLIAETDKPVVAALVGTAGDPQNRDRQAERLAQAGARVFASNAAAARAALASIRS